MIGVFQANAVSLDGLHHFIDSLVLCHNGVLQFSSHTFKPYFFLSTEFLHRYSSHHRHNVLDIARVNDLFFHIIAISPSFVHFLKLILQLSLHVTVGSCEFVVLVFYGSLLLHLHFLQFVLFVSNFFWHLTFADANV